MVIRNERGSLALEQVLFIGAIVLMAGGLFFFYNSVGNYFRSVSVQDLAQGGSTSATPNP